MILECNFELTEGFCRQVLVMGTRTAGCGHCDWFGEMWWLVRDIVVGIYGERGSNDRLWVRKQMVVCRGDETGNGDYGFRLTRNGSGGPGGEWQGGAKMVL